MLMPSGRAPRGETKNYAAYLAIARNLREFGYDGISANMIAEVDEAEQSGGPLPHGVIGMFARDQLHKARENGQVV